MSSKPGNSVGPAESPLAHRANVESRIRQLEKRILASASFDNWSIGEVDIDATDIPGQPIRNPNGSQYGAGET